LNLTETGRTRLDVEDRWLSREGSSSHSRTT
jgi:hypothetical protein